jgi:uncharacterized protein (TIGR03382 family)
MALGDALKQVLRHPVFFGVGSALAAGVVLYQLGRRRHKPGARRAADVWRRAD